jgi:DNA-binding MarR family transcriptional regulator
VDARPGQHRGDDPVVLVGLVFETAIGLRRAATSRVEQDHGLPAQSFDVLVRLARAPGQRLRMIDLAAEASLSPSGLTRSVDRLEAAGLVERESCREDRRGAFAVLTLQGRDQMAEVLRSHREQVERVLEAAMTLDERRQLAALLERLRDSVSPETGR